MWHNNSFVPGDDRLARFLKTIRSNSPHLNYEKEYIQISDFTVGLCLRLSLASHERGRGCYRENLEYSVDCILPGGHLASCGHDIKEDSSPSGFTRDRFQHRLSREILIDQANEKKYRESQAAFSNKMLTRFLIFSVSPQEAQAFSLFWKFQAKSYARNIENSASIPYQAFKDTGIFRLHMFPIRSQALFNNLKKNVQGRVDFPTHKGVGFLGFDFLRKRLEVLFPRRGV